MSYTKPYLTSSSIVESIKLRMMFPLSQETFKYNDILNIVNEEMMINAVPQVKKAHEEYFVFNVIVPIVEGIAKYEIPNRALGMALRDLFYADSSGNYVKMSRVAPEDKAFFQSNSSSTNNYYSYYLQGNYIILNQQISTGATGNLNFEIYLRPNYLVRDNRACIIQNYVKYLTIANNSAIVAGDKITITTESQTVSPTVTTLTAVTGAPVSNKEFQIGASASLTAINLNSVINALSIENVTSTVSTTNVIVTYKDISATFSTSNQTAFTIDSNNVLIKFDQLPTTYIDPDTDVTSDLYVTGGLIDILQTAAGHTTYAYDVKLVEILSGNIGKFAVTELQGYLNNVIGGDLGYLPIKVGDYICPQNECIIPQIPSELHYALAERAANFILSAIGDESGHARSDARIQKMNEAQSALIDSRVTGSVPKVFNPNNLLRSGKGWRRGRW